MVLVILILIDRCQLGKRQVQSFFVHNFVSILSADGLLHNGSKKQIFNPIIPPAPHPTMHHVALWEMEQEHYGICKLSQLMQRFRSMWPERVTRNGKPRGEASSPR